MNFGESAYSSTQEVIQLLLLLQQGKIPDLVIFYDGWNDTAPAIAYGDAGLPVHVDRMRDIYNEAGKYQTYSWLKKSSAHVIRFADVFFGYAPLIEWVRGKLEVNNTTNGGELSENGLSPESTSKMVVDRYIANVKTVRALADSFHFETYAFWQPSVFTKKNPSEEEKSHIEIAIQNQRVEPLRIATHLKTIELLREKELVSESIFDISGAFDSFQNTIFTDTVHITPEGNRVVAKEIVKAILSGNLFQRLRQ
jgi:lysophospholipase L1-like esterase